jgi:hemolysin activation/secretion protein
MQDTRPDVRLQPEAPAADSLEYPKERETPSFFIFEILLEGEKSHKFHWALEAVDGAVGTYLGPKGVDVVMRRVQNAIVKKGFTTTRVVAPQQDLKTGTLRLKLIPGLIGEISLTADSGKYQYLFPVLPLRSGALLNIHDVEQGLENMRRIPGVETDIKLIPGEMPARALWRSPGRSDFLSASCFPQMTPVPGTRGRIRGLRRCFSTICLA